MADNINSNNPNQIQKAVQKGVAEGMKQYVRAEEDKYQKMQDPEKKMGPVLEGTKALNAATKDLKEFTKTNLANVASALQKGMENAGLTRVGMGLVERKKDEIESLAEFASETIKNIRTEKDLGKALISLKKKLDDTGLSLSDLKDNMDLNNKEFSNFNKDFNFFNDERNKAEKKQRELARFGIATKILDNNKIETLNKEEQDEIQKKIKDLRDANETALAQIKFDKDLDAEKKAQISEEITLREEQIQDFKNAGVKELRKYDDNAYRMEFLNRTIEGLTAEGTKFSKFQKRVNKVMQLVPQPIKTAVSTISNTLSTAFGPFLEFLKPFKIFLPIIDKGLEKFVGLFGKKKEKIDNQNIKATQENTKAQLAQLQVQQQRTNQLKKQLNMFEEEKDGEKEKTKEGSKFSKVLGKVTGFFGTFAKLIPALLIALIPLTIAFLLFKNTIFKFLDNTFGTDFYKPPPPSSEPEGLEGLTVTLGGTTGKKELEDLATDKVKEELEAEGKDFDTLRNYEKNKLIKEEKKRINEMTPDAIREEFGEKGDKFAIIRAKDMAIKENLKLKSDLGLTPGGASQFLRDEFETNRKLNLMMNPDSFQSKRFAKTQMSFGDYSDPKLTRMVAERTSKLKELESEKSRLMMERYEKEMALKENRQIIQQVNSQISNTPVKSGGVKNAFDEYVVNKIIEHKLQGMTD